MTARSDTSLILAVAAPEANDAMLFVGCVTLRSLRSLPRADELPIFRAVLLATQDNSMMLLRPTALIEANQSWVVRLERFSADLSRMRPDRVPLRGVTPCGVPLGSPANRSWS